MCACEGETLGGEPPGYPLAPGPFGEPAPELAALRARAPLVRVRLWDGRLVWLATRYDVVRELLGHSALSAEPSAPGYPALSPARVSMDYRDDALNHLDPPRHDEQRRLLAREFTLRAMREFASQILAVVTSVIDDLPAAPRRADFAVGLCRTIPMRVIVALLGIDKVDHAFVERRSAIRMDTRSTADSAAQAHRELVGYLEKVVLAKLGKASDDLIGRMSEHVSGGLLTTAELVDLCRLLLVNGYETTSSAMALGLALILPDRDLWAELGAGQDLLDPVVDEVLRHRTIVHSGPVRAVRADLRIGGVRLREGDGVILSLVSANRDPARFAKADQFDPRHGCRDHLAFGFGPHQCAGHLLARAELMYVYAELARRLPDLRLAADPSDDWFARASALLRLNHLPVTW